MAKIKKGTEKIAFEQAQKAEDVERISNILSRRNPHLRAMKAKSGFSLIERFPGIDFMIYEEERLKSEKKKVNKKCQ